jgi:hypothetical protein
MTIIPDRLVELDTISLASGKHDTFDDGACLLEAVAWVAGEPWSDHPACVDPVLGAFGRAWNDALLDDDRNRLLKPFIPRLVGTAQGPDIQDRRAFLACDWVVRMFTPAWLMRAGLDEDAQALVDLSALSSANLCRAAMPVIAKARTRADAAGDAAGAAAGDAAQAAAWAAAGAAAWAAAWAATGAAAGDAAGAAAWAAAGAAAGDAAGDAAWDAAGDVLRSTVVELQESARDLFDRMIAVTEVAA